MPVALRLILVLAAALLLASTALAVVMAYLLLRPPRMTDGKAVWTLKRLSPADLGLAFEPMGFRIRDERSGGTLTLAAWWMPHAQAQGRSLVLLHGYADAKVGAIAWAPLFHELGFNILALDLRAHGESQGSISTAGYYERHDVEQVLNEVRARMPAETTQLTLFGASTGAAVAAAVAARRDDLAGIILDSPVSGFRNAARAHLSLLGLPGGPVQAAALVLAEWMSGARFEAVSSLATIPQARCPVMIIQCQSDPFSRAEDQAALRAALESRSDPADVYWHVEQCAHLMAICADPDAYRRRVGEFLLTAAAARTVA